jgi:uncharacterized protein (DUF488 family)
VKKQTAKKKAIPILTIGHSTRTLEAFIRLLQTHQVTRVIDVRTVPRSRHNPQFNKDGLADALRSAGIAYDHMPGLGGLRHTSADSPNKGWHHASFRGFADYMQTDDFTENLKALIGRARQDRVALMCAEAVPWRCHRSLIADALSIQGIPVEHILSGVRTQAHAITPWAHVQEKRITYPAEEAASTQKTAPDDAATFLQ